MRQRDRRRGRAGPGDGGSSWGGDLSWCWPSHWDSDGKWRWGVPWGGPTSRNSKPYLGSECPKTAPGIAGLHTLSVVQRACACVSVWCGRGVCVGGWGVQCSEGLVLVIVDVECACV